MTRFRAPFSSPRFLRQYFLRRFPGAGAGGPTPPTSPPSTGTIILHDNCDAVGSITGQAPSPVQPGTSVWTYITGAMNYNGAGQIGTSGTGIDVFTINSTVATGTYSCVLKSSVTEAFYVRWNGFTNTQYFRVVVSTTSGGDYIKVQSYDGTTLEDYAIVNSAGVAVGDTNAITVDVTATDIRVRVGSIYDETVTSSLYNTNTYTGIAILHSAVGALFDDIKVVQ